MTLLCGRTVFERIEGCAALDMMSPRSERQRLARLLSDHVRGIPVRPVLITLTAARLLVLAMGHRRTPERGREFGRRDKCGVVSLDAAGRSRSDLLQQPAVSGRIAEGGPRGVAAPFRVRTADAPFTAGVVVNFAHVDTAIGEFGARYLDVRHDELANVFEDIELDPGIGPRRNP